MYGIHRATWSNGKTTMTGTWEYIWQSDTFVVRLDGGRGRRVLYAYDAPEWGKWKRVVKSVEATQ